VAYQSSHEIPHLSHSRPWFGDTVLAYVSQVRAVHTADRMGLAVSPWLEKTVRTTLHFVTPTIRTSTSTST
jgi:hypothetical protein